MSGSPDVLDGLRAPRAVRLESMAARAAAGEPLPQPLEQPGVTVYVSKFRRYRVQITSPLHTVNPMTGQPIPGGRELVAQFDEGVFRNTEADPEARALIDQTLQRNKYFGKFGSNADFWLASEQQATLESRRLETALATLRGLPKEAVERFVADLKQGTETDHALPPVADAAATQRLPEPAVPVATRPIVSK